MPTEDVAEWIVTTTADNAAATVQKAAEVGRVHFITSISGSFSSAQAAAKLMTLKNGAATIGNFHVFNNRDVPFVFPIMLSPNTLAELSLPASGTGGQVGAVTMSGYTVG